MGGQETDHSPNYRNALDAIQLLPGTTSNTQNASDSASKPAKQPSKKQLAKEAKEAKAAKAREKRALQAAKRKEKKKRADEHWTGDDITSRTHSHLQSEVKAEQEVITIDDEVDEQQGSSPTSPSPGTSDANRVKQKASTEECRDGNAAKMVAPEQTNSMEVDGSERQAEHAVVELENTAAANPGGAEKASLEGVAAAVAPSDRDAEVDAEITITKQAVTAAFAQKAVADTAKKTDSIAEGTVGTALKLPVGTVKPADNEKGEGGRKPPKRKTKRRRQRHKKARMSVEQSSGSEAVDARSLPEGSRAEVTQTQPGGSKPLEEQTTPGGSGNANAQPQPKGGGGANAPPQPCGSGEKGRYRIPRKSLASSMSQTTLSESAANEIERQYLATPYTERDTIEPKVYAGRKKIHDPYAYRQVKGEALRFSETPPTADQCLALVCTRMASVPHVTSNRIAYVNDRRKIRQSIKDLESQAPLPLRRTYSITMQYYIDKEKRPFDQWPLDTQKAIGYVPKVRTAACAPLLMAVMDSHGTGAVYDLTKLNTTDVGEPRTVAKELIAFLTDPLNKWVMLDSCEGKDVPTGGGVELYRTLLKNWSGENLCPNLVSTKELLRNSGYPTYANAIEALVPKPWQSAWRLNVSARGKREMRATMEFDITQDEADQIGVADFQKAAAEEIGVDNFLWRMTWLRGSVNTEKIEEGWIELAKLWQNESGIPVAIAARGWNMNYTDTQPGAKPFRALIPIIWKKVLTCASRLKRARSDGAEQVEVGESIMWTAESLVEQAYAFEEVLRRQSDASDLTQPMFRQLKSRLFAATKARYDAIKKIRRVPWLTSKPPEPKRPKKAVGAAAKPVAGTSAQPLAAAATPPERKSSTRDQKSIEGKSLPAAQYGSRQHWQKLRPLRQPTMPKERQQGAPKGGRDVLVKSKTRKSRLQSGSKRTCSDSSEVSSSASDSDDSDEGQEECEPIRTHRPKTHSERQKEQRPVRLGLSVVKRKRRQRESKSRFRRQTSPPPDSLSANICKAEELLNQLKKTEESRQQTAKKDTQSRSRPSSSAAPAVTARSSERRVRRLEEQSTKCERKHSGRRDGLGKREERVYREQSQGERSNREYLGPPRREKTRFKHRRNERS